MPIFSTTGPAKAGEGVDIVGDTTKATPETAFEIVTSRVGAQAKNEQKKERAQKGTAVGKEKNTTTNPPAAKDDNESVVSTQAPYTAVTLYRPSRLYNYRPDEATHVWLRLSARPIEKQAAWARSDKGPIQAGARKFEFNFLAPNEIQEIVSHEWAPYESVAAKLAEKAAWLGRAGMEWKNIQTQTTRYMDSLDKNKSKLGQAATQARKQGAWNTIHALAVAGSKADVFQHRVDTALVYKNSERRKYDFVFYLADVGGSSLYDEVVYPVKLLQYLSTPTKDEDQGNKSLASIKAPFFFEIQTWPIDYIKVKYAACTLVQPTWKGPYIYGIPSHCELHLSFVEIEPLWDSMFIDDRRITWTSKGNADQQPPMSPAIAEKIYRTGE